jgi:hypothetical protein
MKNVARDCQMPTFKYLGNAIFNFRKVYGYNEVKNFSNMNEIIIRHFEKIVSKPTKLRFQNITTKLTKLVISEKMTWRKIWVWHFMKQNVLKK